MDSVSSRRSNITGALSPDPKSAWTGNLKWGGGGARSALGRISAVPCRAMSTSDHPGTIVNPTTLNDHQMKSRLPGVPAAIRVPSSSDFSALGTLVARHSSAASEVVRTVAVSTSK